MTETTAIRPGIGAIVRDRSGRVLPHLRRVEWAWAPISGRVEPGETLLQALHREINEETALSCRSERLIGVYSDPGYQIVTYQDGRRFHFVTAVFEVEAF